MVNHKNVSISITILTLSLVVRVLCALLEHMFVLSSQSNIIESGGAERRRWWVNGRRICHTETVFNSLSSSRQKKKETEKKRELEHGGRGWTDDGKSQEENENWISNLFSHIFFLFYLSSSSAQKKNSHSSSNGNTLEIGIIIIIQLNSIQIVVALTWRPSALTMAPKAHCSSPELSSETVEIILAFPKAPFLLRDTFMFWTVSRCLSFSLFHVDIAQIPYGSNVPEVLSKVQAKTWKLNFYKLLASHVSGWHWERANCGSVDGRESIYHTNLAKFVPRNSTKKNSIPEEYLMRLFHVILPYFRRRISSSEIHQFSRFDATKPVQTRTLQHRSHSHHHSTVSSLLYDNSSGGSSSSIDEKCFRHFHRTIELTTIKTSQLSRLGGVSV